MLWAEWLSLLLVSVGNTVVCRMNKHLLCIFIGLEMMGLGLLFASHIFLLNQFWAVLLALCMAVCEASICLALLVLVMRLCGNDKMSSLSINEV
uniref:NADH-ubiquinone oxidoreductase chain 4L n=1 Tax=Mytilus californianus TaxID=6549 RepID=G3BJX0_MYTCA|nr:NADH dehydrogenase subunit 4L [Mytilus californianus]